MFTTAIAQVDDELDMLEEEEVSNCIPENLTVPYDSYVNSEAGADMIRQWYSFGSEYHKNKNYKAALPYLWKVFVNDSTKYAKLAIRKIAESYFNLQQVDSTLIACYRGLDLFPDHITLHYYAGYLQDRLGKSICAIPHYEALVADNPKEKNYLEKLAFLYFNTENQKAIEIQEKLVALDPANAEYQKNLYLYSEYFLGKGGGLEAIKNAWANEQDNHDFAIRYARAAYDAGEYQQAMEPLNHLINKNGKDVDALKYRAMTFESLEKYESAIADYKAWLNVDENNADIMCAIANNYRNVHQYDNGKYWVNRALRAKPGFGLAYVTMGELLESSVNYCQNKMKRERKYDDGFVYGLALEEYRKAMNDMDYRAIASQRIQSLKSYLLTDEEKFMHTGPDLKLDCYEWINK